MKKLLIALSLLGMVSTLNAEIVKIVKPTNSQDKKIKKLYDQDELGHAGYWSTNKGIISYDFRDAGDLDGAVYGDCFDVEISSFKDGSGLIYVNKAKKVKCPKNLQDKKNR